MPNHATCFDARGHAGRHGARYVLVLVIGALTLAPMPAHSRSDPNAQASRASGSAHLHSTPTATTLPVAASAPVVELQPAGEPATTTPPSPPGYGCAAALAYLAAHANPEFTFACPGYADGHEAMTCVNIVGLCGDAHVIVINDPCPAAYMNEAYNSQSWSDSEGTFVRPIDPYGAC